MEFLRFGFMQRALLEGAMIGVLCALLGVFVVLRNLSFVSAGISHAAFGGVALGYLLGINVVMTAMVFCVLVGISVSIITQKSILKEDTVVGILYASTMALGVFFMSFTKGYSVDLFSYLFGSILAVTQFDLIVTAWVGSIATFLVLFFFKELTVTTLDPETAKASGIPAEAFHYLFTALVALVIVVSIRVVGIILVSALLVLPAATALRIARTMKGVTFLALTVSLISSLGGLILSYFLNTPSGATIVLLGAGIFGGSFLFHFPR